MLGALVAHHRGCQSKITRLQPFFAATGEGRTADQNADGDGQENAEDAGKYAAQKRSTIGIVHFLEALCPQYRFFSAHRRELSAHGIHSHLAAIGVDDCQCRVQTLAATKIDRLLQLRQLGIDMLLEYGQAPDLGRIIAGELANFLDLGRDRIKGRVVRIEVPFVVRE